MVGWVTKYASPLNFTSGNTWYMKNGGAERGAFAYADRKREGREWPVGLGPRLVVKWATHSRRLRTNARWWNILKKWGFRISDQVQWFQMIRKLLSMNDHFE